MEKELDRFVIIVSDFSFFSNFGKENNKKRD